MEAKTEKPADRQDPQAIIAEALLDARRLSDQLRLPPALCQKLWAGFPAIKSCELAVVICARLEGLLAMLPAPDPTIPPLFHQTTITGEDGKSYDVRFYADGTDPGQGRQANPWPPLPASAPVIEDANGSEMVMVAAAAAEEVAPATPATPPPPATPAPLKMKWKPLEELKDKRGRYKHTRQTRGGKWEAQVSGRAYGGYHHLGTFDSAELASAAAQEFIGNHDQAERLRALDREKQAANGQKKEPAASAMDLAPHEEAMQELRRQDRPTGEEGTRQQATGASLAADDPGSQPAAPSQGRQTFLGVTPAGVRWRGQAYDPKRQRCRHVGYYRTDIEAAIAVQEALGNPAGARQLRIQMHAEHEAARQASRHPDQPSGSGGSGDKSARTRPGRPGTAVECVGCGASFDEQPRQCPACGDTVFQKLA